MRWGLGRATGYRQRVDGIKVYNNLCYSNGGDGILLYHYPGTINYARNVSIINNTTYNNNQSPTAPYYGGIATDHGTATNVAVRNNISFENLGFAVKKPWNPATVVDHNLTVDPQFLNSVTGDFHLHSSSPAIHFGSPVSAPRFDFDGSVRPDGPAPSAGALQYFPPSPFKLQLLWIPGQSAPGLILQGAPESHYRLEWQSTLDGATWNLLQEISSLPCTPWAVSDPTPTAAVLQRFYRAVLIP